MSHTILPPLRFATPPRLSLTLSSPLLRLWLTSEPKPTLTRGAGR